MGCGATKLSFNQIQFKLIYLIPLSFHQNHQFSWLLFEFQFGGLYCYNIFSINSQNNENHSFVSSIEKKSFIFSFVLMKWRMIELFDLLPPLKFKEFQITEWMVISFHPQLKLIHSSLSSTLYFLFIIIYNSLLALTFSLPFSLGWAPRERRESEWAWEANAVWVENWWNQFKDSQPHQLFHFFCLASQLQPAKEVKELKSLPRCAWSPALFALFFSALFHLFHFISFIPQIKEQLKEEQANNAHKLFFNLISSFHFSIWFHFLQSNGNGREKRRVDGRAGLLCWLVAVRLLPPLTHQQTIPIRPPISPSAA